MHFRGIRHKVHRVPVVVFAVFVLVIAAALYSVVCFANDKRDENTVVDVIPQAAVATQAQHLIEPFMTNTEITSATVIDAEEPVDEVRIYENISLSEELQRLVWQACDEAGCPYELVLSIIFCESNYRNVNGDGGRSIGYMQIQPRWHQARMEKLGVTDLTDPLSNFRVGCDLLAELLGKHSVEDALSVYNTGGTGHRSYANKVISYMEETFSHQ